MRIKIIKLFATLLVCFFLFSCSYETGIRLKSSLLSDYHYNPKVEKQKALLKYYREKVLASEKRKMPIPGLYVDYGLLLFQAGKMEEGKKMMNLEIKYFPESRKYVEAISSTYFAEPITSITAH